MDPLIYAQLLLQFGIPLANQIVQWVHDGKQVTPADFALITELGAYRSTDALTKAGIKIVDGVVVKLDGTPLVVQ